MALSRRRGGGGDFAVGVFFLTASNVLTKLCGLFLRVPLTNMLGDSGMAYFNLAYAVYKWFYMIATAGLPVAAAILCARYANLGTHQGDIGHKDALRRVRNVTLGAFCVIGGVGSACMYFGAPLFASLQGVQAAHETIEAVAPALFFICIASALRGWYQGLDRLFPAALSQVMEAFFKMTAGLWLGGYAIRRGYSLPTVAAYAIMGLGLGSFVGMLVMVLALPFISRRAGVPIFQKRKHKADGDSREKSSRWQMLSSLLRIAVPVTLSASVLSLCDMLDSMIVIRRMCDAGISEAETLRLFGNYTSLCVPMFNLPPILIYPVTTALIPRITAAHTDRALHKKRDTIIRASLWATSVIAFPCAAGMSVLSREVLSLLYRDDLAVTGAPLLRILALAVVFLSLLAMTNAILQAIDCAKFAVYSICAGAVVKLITSWILTGIQDIGILGTPISTLFCYAVMAISNLIFVVIKTGATLPFAKMLLKPCVCALFCAWSAKTLVNLFSLYLQETLATLLGIASGGIIYLAAMVVLRGFDREVLSLVLNGRKRRAGRASAN